MNNQIIEEAIANMASTSKALEAYCNDPKNSNSYGTQLLEYMSWELEKQANELVDLQRRVVQHSCCSYGCMECLGISWGDLA